jgi:hypothetical protein
VRHGLSTTVCILHLFHGRFWRAWHLFPTASSTAAAGDVAGGFSPLLSLPSSEVVQIPTPLLYVYLTVMDAPAGVVTQRILSMKLNSI